MTHAIQACGVSMRLGRKTLLDHVSFDLAPGEGAALVGPNGAGKSTLLRILSGEIVPTEGLVKLFGRSPRSYAARELAQRRAMLAQHVAVAFPFSVAEVVRMGAGDERGPLIDAMAEQALAEVDLVTFGERIIGTLSGGEQQRVHLARILVQLRSGERHHGPGVLLLDEPTASLDICHQLDLLGIVRRCLANGTTVIVTVHDLNLAAMLADRIVVLDRGRLVSQGAPAGAITETMLGDVFHVASVVNRAPRAGVPFVLPHEGVRRPR